MADLNDLRILEGTTVVNQRNGYKFVLDSIIGTDLTRGGWIFRSRFSAPASTSGSIYGPTEGVVTLKVIDQRKTTEYEKICNEFNAILNLSSLLRNHPNIVVASHSFNYEDRRTCRMFSFVSFPYSSEGSIQSILNQRYPNGVPKNVAAVILKELVCGLSAYHTTGLSHNFIHSGAIYVNNEEGGIVSIRLGLPPAIYSHDADAGQGSVNRHWEFEGDGQTHPMKLVFQWGSETAIKKKNNIDSDQKSDIWMVGITALELAYGHLPLSNKGIKKIVNYIQRTKRVPNTDELAQVSTSNSLKNIFTRTFGCSREVRRSNFDNFVCKCLKRRSKRSTARQLLNHSLFDIEEATLQEVKRTYLSPPPV